DLRTGQFSSLFLNFAAFERTGDVSEIEITYRFGGKRAQSAAEPDHVAAFGGMISVREQDHESPGKRIDPQRCAGPAGMPVRADRKVRTPRASVRSIDVPAEPTAVAHLRWSLDAMHQSDRFGF